MAEGWRNSPKNTPCRYFMGGHCQQGTNCNFSHDRSHTPSNDCQYFLVGQCTYGDACRYRHKKPERIRGQRNIEQTYRTGRGLSPYIPPVFNITVPTTSGFNSNTDNTRITPSTNDSSNSDNKRDCPSEDNLSSTSHKPNPSALKSSNMTVLSKASNSIQSSSTNSSNSIEENSSSSHSKSKSSIENLPKVSTNADSVSTSGESNKNKQSKKTMAAPTQKVNPIQLPTSSWADAPEFVPRFALPDPPPAAVTWANVAGGTSNNAVHSVEGYPVGEAGELLGTSTSELCPYFYVNQSCAYQDSSCPYIHGDVCDLCQLACLHPHDEHQRAEHIKECTIHIEQEMEHSFAVARSQKVTCGICMDIIMERSLPSQRRFGILPNCSHSYCLDCIRKWRQAKQFDNKIIRSCPECRIQSDYIVPSRFWVDEQSKDEKDKLVDSYRDALGKKECKYFNKGAGTCPFGNKCFYKHALPDGTLKDVGPPKRKRRVGADGEVRLYMENMLLWDFMEEREQRMELLRGSIQSLLLELEMDEFADNFLEAE